MTCLEIEPQQARLFVRREGVLDGSSVLEAVQRNHPIVMVYWL
jgi:hypothetical protein